jgi:hypothetical protein
MLLDYAYCTVFHQLNFCINDIDTGFYYLKSVNLDGFPYIIQNVVYFM